MRNVFLIVFFLLLTPIVMASGSGIIGIPVLRWEDINNIPELYANGSDARINRLNVSLINASEIYINNSDISSIFTTQSYLATLGYYFNDANISALGYAKNANILSNITTLNNAILNNKTKTDSDIINNITLTNTNIANNYTSLNNAILNNKTKTDSDIINNATSLTTLITNTNTSMRNYVDANFTTHQSYKHANATYSDGSSMLDGQEGSYYLDNTINTTQDIKNAVNNSGYNTTIDLTKLYGVSYMNINKVFGNCSGNNCDIGWGNLTSVPAGFADGVDADTIYDDTAVKASITNNATLAYNNLQGFNVTVKNWFASNYTAATAYADTRITNNITATNTNINNNYTSLNNAITNNHTNSDNDITNNRTAIETFINTRIVNNVTGTDSDISNNLTFANAYTDTHINTNVSGFLTNGTNANFGNANATNLNATGNVYAADFFDSGANINTLYAGFTYIDTRINNNATSLTTLITNTNTSMRNYVDANFTTHQSYKHANATYSDGSSMLDGQEGSYYLDNTINTTQDIKNAVNNSGYNTTEQLILLFDNSYYNSELDLTNLLDNNYVAIGTKLGNTTAEIWGVCNNNTFLTNINGTSVTFDRINGTSLNISGTDNKLALGWGNITSMPSGFADGIDDTGAGGDINGTDISTLNINTSTLNVTNNVTIGTGEEVLDMYYENDVFNFNTINRTQFKSNVTILGDDNNIPLGYGNITGVPAFAGDNDITNNVTVVNTNINNNYTSLNNAILNNHTNSDNDITNNVTEVRTNIVTNNTDAKTYTDTHISTNVSGFLTNGTSATLDKINGTSLNISGTDNKLALGWGNITSIPAGFADGVDNTGSGIGNNTDAQLSNLNVTGTVNATDFYDDGSNINTLYAGFSYVNTRITNNATATLTSAQSYADTRILNNYTASTTYADTHINANISGFLVNGSNANFGKINITTANITSNLYVASEYYLNGANYSANFIMPQNVTWYQPYVDARINNNKTEITTDFIDNIDKNVTKLNNAIVANVSNRLTNNTDAYFSKLGIGAKPTSGYNFTLTSGNQLSMNISDRLYVNETGKEIYIKDTNLTAINSSNQRTYTEYWNGSCYIQKNLVSGSYTAQC